MIDGGGLRIPPPALCPLDRSRGEVDRRPPDYGARLRSTPPKPADRWRQWGRRRWRCLEMVDPHDRLCRLGEQHTQRCVHGGPPCLKNGHLVQHLHHQIKTLELLYQALNIARHLTCSKGAFFFGARTNLCRNREKKISPRIEGSRYQFVTN